MVARKDLNPTERNEVLPFSEGFKQLEIFYKNSRWDEEGEFSV